MPNIKKFRDDFNRIKKDSKDKRPTYGIEITTTNNCNFNCKYCFEHGYNEKSNFLEENLDLFFERIEEIRNSEWFNKEFKGLRIGFWGGEPTLNPELIKKITDRYMNNQFVGFNMYTNGSHISDIMDILLESKNQNPSKFTVQVSYDGLPIHDIYRGNTSDIVLKSCDILYENEIPFGFKSTLPIDAFNYIIEVWEDFEKLYEKYEKNRQYITYAATIDYHNENNDDNIDELKNSLIKVAKKEINFYKRNKRFLSSFFGDGFGNKHCMAGKLFSHIHTDGNFYFCHGCMYSPNKEDFKFSSLNDKNLINKLEQNYNDFLYGNQLDERSKHCHDCEADLCLKCNVLKYDNSIKDGFVERWYDYINQPHLCKYYKEIGIINKAIRKILKGE